MAETSPYRAREDREVIPEACGKGAEARTVPAEDGAEETGAKTP